MAGPLLSNLLLCILRSTIFAKWPDYFKFVIEWPDHLKCASSTPDCSLGSAKEPLNFLSMEYYGHGNIMGVIGHEV